VDGTDIEVFAEVFREAVGRARAGEGPALVEATCYRFRGHYEGDTDHYRAEAEKLEMLEQGDPLTIARARLLGRGEADESQLSAVEAETRAEIRSILEAVRAAPDPDPADALTDVFVPSGP
jgi:pyruvate dehydrogenase E1 component alpha subunit